VLLYCGSFFVFGYVFHNFRLILTTFDRSLNGFLGISVILLPLAIMATASEFALADVDPQTHAAAVAFNACLTWSLIHLFMGLFLRFLDYKSPIDTVYLILVLLGVSDTHAYCDDDCMVVAAV